MQQSVDLRGEKEISLMPNKMGGETTMEGDKDRKLCRAPPNRRGSGIFHLLCINLSTLGEKTCAVASDKTFIYSSMHAECT